MEGPNSSEHEHYEYDNDYFNPENSIRLLKFTDVSADEERLCEVSCKLVTWDLSEAGDTPPFNAISYTWGPNHWDNQARMLINNRVLMITKNCEDALEQARHYNKEAWYWIDSVCIDQHNKKEKAFQIPLMGHIYGTAEHVLACVGQHNDGSNKLFRFIQDKSEILRSGPLDQVAIYRLYLRTCARTLERFLARPYFSRVWILQELHLATRVEFFCSTDTVSAQEIYTLCRHITHSLPTTRELLESAASEGNSTMSLNNALRKVNDAKLQCSLMEDKLFGVLALVDWKGKAPIVPNYEGRDVYNLAVTVLTKISELEGSVSHETARLIAGVLGLLDADDTGSISGLDTAINRRRLSIPIRPRELIQDHPNMKDDRDSSAVMCYGWRLRGELEMSHWYLEGHPDTFQIPVPFRPTAEDKKLIWLPGGTKPGDLYLVPEGGKGHVLHGLVLIVRTSSTWTNPECHDIVGIGFDHGWVAECMGITAHDETRNYDRFGVVASCEDRLFLLIALRVYHQAMDRKSSQRPKTWSQVSSLLGARPCGSKDLSFAFSIRWPGQGEFLQTM